MARITQFDLFATEFPFRTPFKHAAAERRTSYSLFLRATTDAGAVGFGESLPREYVTGESRDDAFAMLQERILPRLLERRFESMDDVLAFLMACDGKAPREWVAPDMPQTAAWCAVDLALLDGFGRAFDEPVRLTSRTKFPPDVRYSVVISSSAGWKTLLATRLFGIRQVKLKVEHGREVEATRRARRWLGRGCDIRVDANMAWTPDEALDVIRKMAKLGVHSYEQPLPADDIAGLARLVAESGEGIMADESLDDRDSLEKLLLRKACTAVNVRVSKCGGLVGALNRCRESLAAGLDVQIGCQVGESSLLSAAHLILVTAVERVKYAEGCFGHLLLREDPVAPLMQFKSGGRAPAMPTGPGLGVTVNDEMLARYTERHTVVK